MKDIKGYEGIYAITEDGRVWSYKSKKFLKLFPNKNGYLRVNLSKNGIRKNYAVHRLVAEAYIPNPEGKTEVNHKDENKQSNCINNLEWVTSKENINYGTHNERSAKSRGKQVYCVELNQVFESISAAARAIGGSNGVLTECCQGKRKTHKGYHWKYVEES